MQLFDIVIAVEVYARLFLGTRFTPTLCAGDTCAYVPPQRGEHHAV